MLLTIDTELVWRHHAAGLSWEENFSRSYEAAGVGVPYQLALLKNHGLKACFFVDPMPALAFGLEPVRRMVDPILAAGQEVQLHLHPFWADLAAAERSGHTPELASFDFARQLELIRQARDLLMAAGAPEPIAFRAGSYAANADTLRALSALGLRYDSSHNGSHHPGPARCRCRRARLRRPSLRKVQSKFRSAKLWSGTGRLRHLQICAISFREMRSALRAAERLEHPLVTIVSHSFELASRDGPSRQQRRAPPLRAPLPLSRAPPRGPADQLVRRPGGRVPCATRPGAAGSAALRLGRAASQLWWARATSGRGDDDRRHRTTILAAEASCSMSCEAVATRVDLPLRVGRGRLPVYAGAWCASAFRSNSADARASAFPACLHAPTATIFARLPAELKDRSGSEAGMRCFERQAYPRHMPICRRAMTTIWPLLAQVSLRPEAQAPQARGAIRRHSGCRSYRTPQEVETFYREARALSALTYQERLLDAGLRGGASRNAGTRRPTTRCAPSALRGRRALSYLYAPAAAARSDTPISATIPPSQTCHRHCAPDGSDADADG
jgi:hypothetical protein